MHTACCSQMKAASVLGIECFMRERTSIGLAVMLALCSSAVASRVCAQVDPQAEAVAQERFTRGRALFEGGEFAGAIEELRRAAALSDSPNVKLYLARAYRAQHRVAEAIAAYQSAERLAAEPERRHRYRETGEAARLERVELEATVARITLNVTPMPRGLVFTLDGESLPVEALGIPYPVSSGTHIVRFEAPGVETQELRLQLQPSSTHEQTISLVAAPQEADPGLSFVGPLVMGVGAALMLGASPSLVLAGDRFEQLRAGCPLGQCPEALRGALDEGRAMESLSIGLLSSGAVVLVVGGVLLALDLGDLVAF